MDSSAETDKTAAHASAPGGKRPARKKRRHLRRLLIVLVVLVLIVGFAPLLLSTGAGTRAIMGLVNSRIKGAVHVDDLSVSWLGPCRVENVRVMDCDGREVLRVTDVQYDRGVLGALLDAMDFGQVSVVSPRVALYLDSRGRSSLAEALKPSRPRQPKPPGPDKPLAAVKGSVKVTGGAVGVFPAGKPDYEITDIQVDLSLDTLDRLAGTLDFRTAKKGRVAISLDLSGLAVDGRLGIGRATGSFSVASPEAVALGPLLSLAAGRTQVGGTAEMRVTGDVKAGTLAANMKIEAAQLVWASPGAAGIRPIDLALTGTLAASAGEVSGGCELTGGGGDLQTTFSLRRGRRLPSLSLEQIVEAALGGRSIRLPDFTFDAGGKIDVLRLSRAVASLLRLLPNVEITSGGQLIVKDIKVRGGERPFLSGSVTLEGLSAQKGQTTVTCLPIVLALDTALEPNAGLVINEISLRSAFAEADGNGRATDLKASFWLDVPKFHEDLGKIFNLFPDVPRGRFNGRLNLRRREKDSVDLDLALAANDLVYRQGDRTLRIDKASLRSRGHVQLDDDKPVKVMISQVTMALADALAAEGSGWYDLRTKGLQAKLKVLRGELKPLLQWGRGLQLPVAKGGGDSGTFVMRSSIARAAADKPLVLDGNAVVRNLAVGGDRVGKLPVNLKWSGVKVYAAPRRIDAKLIRLDADGISLLAEAVRLKLARDIRPEGEFQLTVDIAKAISAARPIAKWKKPPRVSGRLTGVWVCRQVAGGAQLTGSGGVSDFRIVGDQRTFTQKGLTFSHTAVLDQAAERITISKMELDSNMLSFRLAGTVDRLRTERVLNLAGSYEGSWDERTSLLHELSPGTRTTVLLYGKTGGAITVLGPASRPSVRPAFRGLAAKTSVGWTRARFFGVDMGKAKLLPAMDDGQVRLPVTVIGASDGNVRVGGTVDLRGAKPVFSLPGKVKLLDGVRITPQMTEELLSRFNPVFAGLTDANGRVWLTTRDLMLPLGDAIKKSGAGSGRLDLSKLKVRPKGILKTLVALAGPGAGNKQAVRVNGVDFAIRDGRIHYDNFTMVFAGVFDLKFYGSVGFDDTLDMAVSIPVSAALLEKFGARGPVVEYARLLKGARVEVPLVGSRLEPRLDFSKVDIGPLIKRAVEALLSEQLGNTLEKILKSRLPGENQPDGLPDPNDDANDKGGGSLLDSLFDLLE